MYHFHLTSDLDKMTNRISCLRCCLVFMSIIYCEYAYRVSIVNAFSVCFCVLLSSHFHYSHHCSKQHTSLSLSFLKSPSLQNRKKHYSCFRLRNTKHSSCYHSPTQLCYFFVRWAGDLQNHVCPSWIPFHTHRDVRHAHTHFCLEHNFTSFFNDPHTTCCPIKTLQLCHSLSRQTYSV